MTQDHRLGYRIVDAISERTNTDPLELTPRLHDVIDVDALEALYRGDGTDGPTVRFEYGEYLVRVDGPESVTITPNRQANNSGKKEGRESCGLA